MSIVFHTGFDLYTDLTTVFNEITPYSANFNAATQSPGRFGYGQCVQLGGSGTSGVVDVVFPGGPYTRLVMGVAVNIETSSLSASGDILNFIDGSGAFNCGVYATTLGRIGWDNGTTRFLSAPLALPSNQWAYVEVDVIFGGGTSGSVQIRVNGQTVLTETGFAASTITSAYGAGLMWPAYPFPNILFDDMYIQAPSSTTLGDSFLGDVKNVYVLPAGAGHEDAFTQTGGTPGSPWTSVNNVPSDGDTSYIASSTVGAKAMFTTTTPSGTTPIASIYAVTIRALSRKDDSPSRVVSAGVSDGVTDYFDSGAALGSGYSYVNHLFTVNPITGVAFVNADFSTLQFGVEVVS